MWICTQQSWMQKAQGAAGTQPVLGLGQRRVWGVEPHKGGHSNAQDKPVSSAPPGERAGKREGGADAVPGPDLCCHQLPASCCPRGRTGSSNRRPVLALSGSPASQRLELKNSIFPFSGASAPAQGRERSREAPTLPEAAAAAKDALTALAVLGSARWRD